MIPPAEGQWRVFAERSGYPAPQYLAEQRRAMAAAIASGLWRTDPPAQEVVLGGVRALRFDPPASPTATILHFHGGAFRTGAPETIAPFAAALAAQCMARVICPAYRLAPEHPYPAGLNDALAVMRSLQREAQHSLIVSGDSAGGGLAASLTSLAVAAGAPPDRLVLISPWLDLTLASNCYQDNAGSDLLFSRAAAQAAVELYLQGASPYDASASPLFADVSGFPPTLISVGAGEVLADDSRRFHAALISAGAVAVLCEIADMEHVAVTRGFALGGGAQTFAAIIAFVEALSP